MQNHPFFRTPILIALFAALALLVLPAVQAANIVVTTDQDIEDSGDGLTSFREAIIEANNTGGSDEITFDATTFDPDSQSIIYLTSVLPDLTSEIIITGPGANALTIYGEGSFGNYRIFRITSGQTVLITGLTLANGYAQGVNGANGTSMVTPPTAGLTGRGGCIYNSGTLTIARCVLSQNYVYGGTGGTGAANINQNGAAGADGFGGGIYSDGASLSVSYCTFAGNQASGGGGGAGASIQFGGGGSGHGAAAANGRGGAIYVSTGSFTVINSSFSGNIANGGYGGNGGSADFGSSQNLGGAGGTGEGGAIYTLQPATLISCTIAAGSANAGAGGLQIDYSQNAVAGDARGGGIYALGTVNIGNTLLAGNAVTNPGAGVALGPDVFGTFASQNFNLVGVLDVNATGINGAADQSGSVGTPLDPKLAALANNGGTTTTMRLRKGSPAVDKGFGAGVDQRGEPRSVDLADGTYPNAAGGDGSDIGAFESQSLPNDAPVSSSQTFYGNINVAVNTQLTASDADGDPITFEVVSGDLPDGLVLNSDGTITGTPDEAAEVLITFKVNDGMSDSPDATVAIYIAEAPSAVVTTNLDVNSDYDGLISIHEAIGYITNYGLNVPVTFDSIFFASHQTINLTSGLIVINPVDITGPPSGVTINGGNTHTILTVFGFTGSPVFNFSNLTFTQGRSGSGGCALNLNNVGATPTVNVSNCTFKNNGFNNIRGGAIAMNGGTLILTNCTLTGNFTNATAFPSSGGAIYQAAGSLTLYHCTITGNQSTGNSGGTGGAILSEGGTLSIGNSIIAGNTANTHSDISGTVNSLGYNLIGDTTGATITGVTTGNQLNVSPGFDPEGLANNGGATDTIALAPGSLAIDQGKALNGATTDQRGEVRPYDDLAISNASGGDGSDIGAYETPAPSSEIQVAISDGGRLTDGFGSVNFGSRHVGSSTDVVFDVTNLGTLELTLNGSPKVAVSGAHAALFVVTAQPTSPVDPDGTTTFTVRFTPDSLGVKTAALTIVNDDSDENPFNIAVTGTGADVITEAPTLTAPAFGTISGSPVSISITLPETGLAGSVTLNFSGDTSHALTLASAAQGTQSFTFNPAVPTAAAEIASGTAIPDGVYSVTLSYQDALGNPGATMTVGNVTIDTTAPEISVPAETRLALAGTLADYTGIADVTDATTTIVTQSPAIGSVTTLGVTTITLTATDAVGLQDSTTFDLNVRPSAATSTTELSSGDTAPGSGLPDGPPADAKLATFGMPATDDEGDLAYQAKWASATNGKGAGLFLNNDCLAIAGGDVSGVSGAKYKSFTDPVVSNGEAATIAKFSGVPAASASAVMTGSTLAVIARAGDIAPNTAGTQPTDGAKFKAFKAVSIQNGNVAIFAQLTGGLGTEKTTAANDYGLWIKSGSDPLTLVLREGQDISGKTIKTLVSFGAGNGSPGQGRGWLSFPGVTAALALVTFTDNSKAVVSAATSGFLFFSETGVANDVTSPDIADATFASLGFPAANNNDSCALLATMTIGPGGITKDKARGIFLRTSGANTQIAATGTTAGTTGANFSTFKDPVLSSDDGVAFFSTIKGGTVKGLAASTIWWKPNGEPLTLLAQGGKPPGPDLSATAQWKSFTSLAIAGGRGPIFAATLVPNKGGVTAAKASGVWGCDFNGDPRLLFRTGDIIGGKTVKSFVILKASTGSPGVTRSFNDSAQVVWLATFTDKTQAIITTEVP